MSDSGRKKKGELDANVNISSARNHGQFYREGVNVSALDECSVLGGKRRFNSKSAAARAEIRTSTLKMDSPLTPAVLTSFSAVGLQRWTVRLPSWLKVNLAFRRWSGIATSRDRLSC